MRQPFTDPNTNIIYDVDNPEYEGWLTKQSAWVKVRLKLLRSRDRYFRYLTFGFASLLYASCSRSEQVATKKGFSGDATDSYQS